MTHQTPELDFSITYFQNNPTVLLPERLTVLEAVAFKETCLELLQQELSNRQLILDFSETKFIDSSGIGALISVFKTAREKDRELILNQVQPPVMAVFAIAGLSEILNIQSVRERSERTRPATPTHPSIQSWIKRGIDILGALVGLTITSLVFIPITIAIKLDSPGPIFFKQTRCGWLGKKFTIWKFRSMCLDAENMKAKIENQASGAFFKNDNDPRITKLGRFLRRTSLDELPQFWNVLKGDMSLVGTRPPTPDEVETYQVPEWQRLNVKPGMTGEWQVNGRSKIRNFEDVIKFDLRYQKNWSLKYDLQLILKTFSVLFDRNSGAV